MLGETGTVGVDMTIFVTVTRFIITLVADMVVKRQPTTAAEGA